MYTLLELEKYTKKVLVEKCKGCGLETKGKKSDLIERLLSRVEVSENPSTLAHTLEHTLEPILEPRVGCIWVASFDIGKNNFSFYIEEINPAELKDIPKFRGEKKNRYMGDGTPSASYKEILNKITSCGRAILIDNLSLMTGCEKGVFDTKLFYNMNEVLGRYTSYWKQCSECIIEVQVSFGRMINLTAIKLAQHCFSWFTMLGADIKIYEFPAYHKTKVLGAGKKFTKPQRKKWAVQEALAILERRGDTTTLSKINSRCKQDDECDVIVQLQAFKVLKYVDNNF